MTGTREESKVRARSGLSKSALRKLDKLERVDSIPEGDESRHEDSEDQETLTESSLQLTRNYKGSRTSTTCAHATNSSENIWASGLNDFDDDGVQVICVGLMRTGLKTLHKALRNVGYSNIYDQEEIVSTYQLWNKVMRNQASEETFKQIFDGSKVIMGMPTFCFWEQIVELYPNARVILTVRDEDEWWESVNKAKKLTHKDMPGAPLSYGSKMRNLERFLMPSYHKFCDVLRFAWATTLGAHGMEEDMLNETVARNNYRRHNNYVKSVLGKERMRDGIQPRLLVYDVKKGWAPLCQFLGKEEPQVEFPSVLNVPYFPGQQDAPVSEEGRNKDQGECFDTILLPDSDFGVKMREELRSGLAYCFLGLTLLVMAITGFFMTQAIHFPMITVAFVYLVIITVGWNTYVVMHSLVLRVPALVVLPMAMKSFLIAGALHACFITYGMLKEMLVVHDKIASPLLVLSSRFMSIICGVVTLKLTQGNVSLGAPLTAMGMFAFTNEASTWAGYEMLRYVSFPIQVMAKSVKMLPSMIMGRLLNGTTYSAFQYVQAIVALICVAIMNSASDDKPRKPSKRAMQDDEGSMLFALLGEYYKPLMGLFMLLIFFACDSFTSQWQNNLYKKYPKLTQTQMMLGGNFLGLVFTSGTIFASKDAVIKSMGVAAENPEVLGRIALLGVAYAAGQFCIYSAIRILGPLSFTWIMTARQLLSVLISLVYFGHGVGTVQLLCILTVFGIMSAKQLGKAMPKISRISKAMPNISRSVSGYLERRHSKTSLPAARPEAKKEM